MLKIGMMEMDFKIMANLENSGCEMRHSWRTFPLAPKICGKKTDCSQSKIFYVHHPTREHLLVLCNKCPNSCICSLLLSGPDHGQCLCGNCSCSGNWTGPSCSCTKHTEGCMKDGVSVNGSYSYRPQKLVLPMKRPGAASMNRRPTKTCLSSASAFSRLLCGKT